MFENMIPTCPSSPPPSEIEFLWWWDPGADVIFLSFQGILLYSYIWDLLPPGNPLGPAAVLVPHGWNSFPIWFRNAINWAKSSKSRPRKRRQGRREDSLSHLPKAHPMTSCFLSEDCLFIQHSIPDLKTSSRENPSPPTTVPIPDGLSTVTTLAYDKHSPVCSALTRSEYLKVSLNF